jgi:hypothetical protein
VQEHGVERDGAAALVEVPGVVGDGAAGLAAREQAPEAQPGHRARGLAQRVREKRETELHAELLRAPAGADGSTREASREKENRKKRGGRRARREQACLPGVGEAMCLLPPVASRDVRLARQATKARN